MNEQTTVASCEIFSHDSIALTLNTVVQCNETAVRDFLSSVVLFCMTLSADADAYAVYALYIALCNRKGFINQ